MRIKRIIKALLHPTTIKTVGLLVIIGTCFILHAHAQTSNDNQSIDATKELLQTLLSLFSRLWVILAILAGKLMSNDFVYGSFLHMDIYLRKIRNIMKNFANFALVGLILVSIIKGIVGKEALDVKKIITNTLIAGILIQASRFLMGAVIDLSSVATAAVGGFSNSFLGKDAALQKNMNDSLSKVQVKKIVVDPNANTMTGAVTLVDEPSTVDENTWSRFLPNANSVSGPFVYLGSAVFSFQEYIGVGSSAIAPLTLALALRFFLIFFFTIGLLLLLIANIIRIGLLRVFIIGSPFLILFQVFGKKLGDGGGALGKIFTVGNLISTAFKPVIFVTGISLMLIVIVSMQNSITGSGATWEKNLNGVELSMDGLQNSQINIEGINTVTVSQKDIFGKDVIGSGQNFFSHLIMLFLSIFIMRRFIKLSLTLGGGTISEKMEVLIKQTEGMAMALPVVPGGYSVSGLNRIRKEQGKKLAGGFGMNTEGEFGELKKGVFTTNASKFDSWVHTNLLGELPPRSPTDEAAIQKAATADDGGASFFSTAIQHAKDTSGGISIGTTSGLAENLRKVISKDMSKDKILGFTGDPLSAAPQEDELNRFFSNKTNIDSVRNAFGGAASKAKTKPTDFESLKSTIFYPGNDASDK